MATYVNDLRLKEIATGDESGTWGTSTNTNLELIGEAFSFGTEAITTNADTHTTTIADGSTDPGRSMYLKYTGTLDSACTITIGPNTVSKMWFIENGTSGSQNIIISQGSGANITIPPGDVKVIYSDGAGSGAAVVDAFASLSVVDLKVQDDLTVTDDMTVGGTLGVTGIVTLTDDLIIGDGKTIGSASDVDAMTIAANGQVTLTQTLIGTALDISGDIDVDGTTNLDVVDIDGAVDMASTLNVSGAITGTLGTAAQPNITSLGTLTTLTVDDITINGSTISDGAALTLDAATEINLDSDSGYIYLKDDGTSIGLFKLTSSDFYIKSVVSDKDIIFQGNDGGSAITALTLDMSNAGAATFNSDVGIGATPNTYSGYTTLTLGSSSNGGIIDFERNGTIKGEIFTEAAIFGFQTIQANDDIIFKGNDGGSTITALTLDMSAAGAATFNTSVLLSGTGGLTTTGGNNLTVSGSVADHAGLIFATHAILPAEEGAEASPNVIDIGANGNEFKSLYLNTSIITDTDLTLDVGGDIIFNADGGDWKFQDGAAGILEVQNDGNGNAVLITTTSDKDMRFLGNDGGSTITALTLDMSNAGAATFNSSVRVDNQASTPVRLQLNNTGSNDYASIYADTASAYKNLLLNPDGGSVGIGISPSNTFSVGASGTVTTRYTSTDTSAFSLLQFENNGSIVLSADHGDSASSTEILFKTDGGTERAKIDSNGDSQFQNRIFAGGGTGANTSVNADDIVIGLTNNSTERGITIASTVGGGIRWNDGADAGTLQYVHSTNRFQFYAAGALKASIDSEGLKFNGDTAAANALDDYEEGTFTPALAISGDASGFGYAVQIGEYVKIGKLVTANVNIQLSSLGTATGSIQCNLPFSSDNSTNFTQFGAAILDNASTTAGAAGIQVGADSQTAALLTANTQNNLAALPQSAQAANFRVRFSFTYKTQ